MRPVLSGVLLLTMAVACRGSTLEPLPLSVTIAADRATAARGDSVLFVVDAQGGQLFGVEIDYGDGATDQFATSGARTARVTFRHAYSTSGTFTARAVVTDVLAGQRDARVEVRIN